MLEYIFRCKRFQIFGIEPVPSLPGNDSVILKFPVAVKLGSYFNLYPADNNNNGIQLYCRYPIMNATARTIANKGVVDSSATTLRYPTGLALDEELNLYISDTSNRRVQLFQRLH
ncbi:unnamed protein product [Rotaria sp. Silwood1]|nr:unnamed protein product [Rotaria sp. Silwood1]CAF5038927.1 unnamed protein product [Rotaria sp. Silwood1]